MTSSSSVTRTSPPSSSTTSDITVDVVAHRARVVVSRRRRRLDRSMRSMDRCIDDCPRMTPRRVTTLHTDSSYGHTVTRTTRSVARHLENHSSSDALRARRRPSRPERSTGIELERRLDAARSSSWPRGSEGSEGNGMIRATRTIPRRRAGTRARRTAGADAGTETASWSRRRRRECESRVASADEDEERIHFIRSATTVKDVSRQGSELARGDSGTRERR